MTTITVEAFVAKYDGKRIGGWSNSSGQCVDQVRQAMREIHGIPGSTYSAISPGNAEDFYANADPDVYAKLARAPGRIPPEGAIVVMRRGVYGHVFIARDGSSSSVIRSFDQNWSKPRLCSKEAHSYGEVVGWLVRKTSSVVVGPSLVEWAFEVAYEKDPDTVPNFFEKVRAKLKALLVEYVDTYQKNPTDSPNFVKKFLANRGIP